MEFLLLFGLCTKPGCQKNSSPFHIIEEPVHLKDDFARERSFWYIISMMRPKDSQCRVLKKPRSIRMRSSRNSSISSICSCCYSADAVTDSIIFVRFSDESAVKPMTDELMQGLRLQMLLTFSLSVQSCYFHDQIRGRCDVEEREGESPYIIDLSDLKPPSTAELTARPYPRVCYSTISKV